MSQAPVLYICMGVGGVGKTTVSAALALAAARLGFRTLVLTIDPSKRLAQVLNLQSHQEESRVWSHEKSYLNAQVLNHQMIFNRFINDGSSSLNANKLFRILSGSLSGSQEFTALEALKVASESGHYDVIVLDTPPAQNSVDFLRAPQKLMQLFKNGLVGWFKKDSSLNVFTGLFQSGTRQVFQLLERITGNEFITELGRFFDLIQSRRASLEARLADFQRMLSSSRTHFIGVTGEDPERLSDLVELKSQIQNEGFNFSGIVINRVWAYSKLELTSEIFSAQGPCREVPMLLTRWQKWHRDSETQGEKILPHFRDYLWARIPETTDPLVGIESLTNIADLYLKEPLREHAYDLA